MKTNSWNLFKSIILMLFVSGCSLRPADRSTGGWDHMMGYGGHGGMLMWLILIVIAAVIVYFVFNQSKRTGNPIDPARETPTEILKRRYANGEITKEEFDRLKNEIEN